MAIKTATDSTPFPVAKRGRTFPPDVVEAAYLILTGGRVVCDNRSEANSVGNCVSKIDPTAKVETATDENGNVHVRLKVSSNGKAKAS